MDNSKLIKVFPQDGSDPQIGSIKSSYKPVGEVVAEILNPPQQVDEVVGQENWTNSFTQSPNGGVLCTLGIKIEDEWVYKTDGADNTEIERVKGGLSNAMKRAGVQWGIGRYLYKLPTTFAEFNHEGRYHAKIDGVKRRWNPPTLSEEFLPTPYAIIKKGDKSE